MTREKYHKYKFARDIHLRTNSDSKNTANGMKMLNSRNKVLPEMRKTE